MLFCTSQESLYKQASVTDSTNHYSEGGRADIGCRGAGVLGSASCAGDSTEKDSDEGRAVGNCWWCWLRTTEHGLHRPTSERWPLSLSQEPQ